MKFKAFILKFKFWKSLATIFYHIRTIRIFADNIAKKIAIGYLSDEYSYVIEKYENYQEPSICIGNRVWVYWNTGIDSLPNIVRICIDSIKKMPGVDLIILDNTNYKEYVNLPKHIIEGFDHRNITVQTFSDILRNSLLSKHGGFWFDATILVLDPFFLERHKDLHFFSIKHCEKKACDHFSKGKLSGFLLGSCKNGLLVSFTAEIYKDYYRNHKKAFDYFMIDYIFCLAYESFNSIRMEIDNLQCENKDVFLTWHSLEKNKNINANEIKKVNNIQKLVWNVKNESFFLNELRKFN